jgi:suppressor for copper-sensitivity B
LTDKISLPTPQFTNVTPSNSLSSDFLSGFLATLLATPCSAPFVGTAVSFALSADYAVCILILMTMGVGLAMPWLVLAIAPQLLLMLPKPGGWLAYVRPALASGLVLTILWLLWLILLASSSLFVVGITAGLLVIWLFSVFGSERFIWPTSIGIAAICISLTGWFNSPPLPADRQSHFIADGGIWQPFSLQLLAELKSQKQATFVDVTAEWCVTCKLNKQLVLEQEPVLQAFAKSDVVLLRADWTRPDDMIADYLLEYGRFGIPFNSLYLPGRAEPIIFSEILSAEKILHALKNYLH